jgi:hypothetical protein
MPSSCPPDPTTRGIRNRHEGGTKGWYAWTSEHGDQKRKHRQEGGWPAAHCTLPVAAGSRAAGSRGTACVAAPARLTGQRSSKLVLFSSPCQTTKATPVAKILTSPSGQVASRCDRTTSNPTTAPADVGRLSWLTEPKRLAMLPTLGTESHRPRFATRGEVAANPLTGRAVISVRRES